MLSLDRWRRDFAEFHIVSFWRNVTYFYTQEEKCELIFFDRTSLFWRKIGPFVGNLIRLISIKKVCLFLVCSILLYFFFYKFCVRYRLKSLVCPKTQYSIITICRESVENFAAFARMECHLESIQTILKTPMNCFFNHWNS